MKFDKLLKAVGTLDKTQLHRLNEAMMDQHRYLNHNPMVYGVTRRMADGVAHHRITEHIVQWGREGVHHPRLWLVPTRKVAEAEVRIKENMSVSWTGVAYKVFSIPKAEALLLPCYRVLKYDQQKEYTPQ